MPRQANHQARSALQRFAYVQNLNIPTQPMHVNEPAQTFFGPHILKIDIFARYMHINQILYKVSYFISD